MYITSLKLHHYRNIDQASLSFSPGVNIIYGKNAQGKTNIVESIFFSSTGRSHRTRTDKELIQFGEQTANIKLSFRKGNFDDQIDIFFKKDNKKGIAINNRPIKRIGELFGELQTVIFSPEDLKIINDSPSERRRFMDIHICQINKIYYNHLHTYHKILKQRNALLKTHDRKNLKETLFVWDAQLVEHGKEIIKIRQNFIRELNPIASSVHLSLTAMSDKKEQLLISYKPSVIEDEFEKRLAKNLDRDTQYGLTSVGPHKDDILFYVDGQEVKTYGSQGQKRTAALACKLAEVELVKNETGQEPVLLLDDALSELDSQRQEMLIEYIGGLQTIITATGMEDLISGIKTDAKVFYIAEGAVE